ncbi:serine-enriched protein-like [Planococcus citri]|uniref:serine-enriched protein-like n=1 Tax=Planococcus citri TaxID=170843 RepID=UPI0031F89C24
MPEGMSAKISQVAGEGEDLTIFDNKSGLADDLKFLASMPELCDVTFLVGETREPVCGVRAILAARSRVFHQMFFQQSSSPQKKKENQAKENKLRMFLKRSSEPTLNVQNNSGSNTGSAQNMPHQTLIIDEFEPDVFRQLIEYIHTGCVTLQPRTLLGVMNAADRYGLEDLRKSCHGFIQSCINVDTVCALLQTADRYVQYKCTKAFLKQVLEFVDEKGNEILNLGSFALLPLHVVRLIFSRKSLVADEFTKFQAALMWTMKYSDMNSDVDWKKVFRDNFLSLIKFHKIPANVLMKEVDPLKVVPNDIIVTALAYQADPSCVDPENPSGSIANLSDIQINNASLPSLELQYASNSTLSSFESSEHVSSDGNSKTQV